MKNPQLQLTDLQDTKIREALDELKEAQLCVAEAYSRLIFAADQDDVLSNTRKLCNHASALDAIQGDLSKAIELITERIAGIYRETQR